MRRTLFRTCMVLFIVLLMGCGAELINRLLGGSPATFLYSGAFRDRQTDWDVTYGITPRSFRVTCGTHSVATAQRTVAVMGDSFVFGQGIQDCQDLSSHLQIMFPHSRFVNYGIIGIGMDEYEMIVRDMIEPNVTDIILIFYGNDIAEINDSKKSSFGKLADISSAFALLRKVKRILTIRDFTAETANNQTALTAEMATDKTSIFNNVASVLHANSDYFINTVEPPEENLRQFRNRFARLIGRMSAIVPRERIWIAEAPEATTVSETTRNFVRNLGGALPTFGRPGSGYDAVKSLANEQAVHFIDL